MIFMFQGVIYKGSIFLLAFCEFIFHELPPRRVGHPHSPLRKTDMQIISFLFGPSKHPTKCKNMLFHVVSVFQITTRETPNLHVQKRDVWSSRCACVSSFGISPGFCNSDFSEGLWPSSIFIHENTKAYGPLPIISRVISYNSTYRGWNSSYRCIRPFKGVITPFTTI